MREAAGSAPWISERGSIVSLKMQGLQDLS